MTRIVLDVLTLKAEDTRPELAMTVDELNEAAAQPTDDVAFDQYSAAMFDEAELIEFHMDYLDVPGQPRTRVVDGREATWDSSSETVSVTLERDDTARTGRYAFEWVLVYDADATSSDDATDVRTVPQVGLFGLTVTGRTGRDLQAITAPNRATGDLQVEGTATFEGDQRFPTVETEADLPSTARGFYYLTGPGELVYHHPDGSS